MREPSQANAAAFDRAVEQITTITRRLLLEELTTSAPPRTREEERARAKARGEKRVERMRAQLAAEADG